jgi:gamma-glutamyltranspeptidase/glutathione hydrolase
LPLDKLVSKDYAALLRKGIRPDKASKSGTTTFEWPAESSETTHLSVVDEARNAVSLTYTLEDNFGSKIVVPGGGFLLNNEMGDFNAGPGLTNADGLIGTDPNLALPGKRMLSSMTPTIVTRGGELRAVLGSPGGPTITTTVAQIAMQLIDYGRALPDAVREPRIHHQGLPDRVLAEQGVPPELVEGLRARGHEVTLLPSLGHANCIEVDPRSGVLRAVADTARDGGKALAW